MTTLLRIVCLWEESSFTHCFHTNLAHFVKSPFATSSWCEYVAPSIHYVLLQVLECAFLNRNPFVLCVVCVVLEFANKRCSAYVDVLAVCPR